MTTVLVVDDSAMDRRLVGRLLERNTDWKILYAASGTEVFSQLELHLPDIVLTDIQMPEMNGLELVSEMKSGFPLVPVVLMTAQGSEELAVKALELGAASYVPKSRAVHELQETIERVLAASSEVRGHSRLMHRLDKLEASFVLETDVSLIPSVISYLQQILMSMRFCDESNRLRIGVALEEALLNAYYHGNLEVSSTLRETDHEAYYSLAKQRAGETPYQDRSIHFTANLGHDRAVYVIRDEGPGFDPSTLPDATDPANIERPCGRGLLLMKTFMDDVIFNEKGNEVTLIKQRSLIELPDGGKATSE